MGKKNDIELSIGGKELTLQMDRIDTYACDDAPHWQAEAADSESSAWQTALSNMEYLLRVTEMNAMKLRNELFEFQMLCGLRHSKTDEARMKKNVLNFERELYDIQVSFSDGILILRCPVILPHRCTIPASVFDNAVDDALKDFMEKDRGCYLRLKEENRHGAVIVFNHNYKADYMVRDNDNIETKNIVDMLVKKHFIGTDRGTSLSIFHKAEYRNDVHENSSEVLLMSKGHFCDWVTTA